MPTARAHSIPLSSVSSLKEFSTFHNTPSLVARGRIFLSIAKYCHFGNAKFERIGVALGRLYTAGYGRTSK